ncbi:uncharacterized protein LOC114254071 [Monomorium pharaonis]|uniref:uncharacterized protein LOC114254071 n=1 Tax=Monomorium pharaonis TaxID=307658 RepID=UPI00174689E4|nr:uncharacterized protein LOC114254071 [Monomorium pharaonis]
MFLKFDIIYVGDKVLQNLCYLKDSIATIEGILTSCRTIKYDENIMKKSLIYLINEDASDIVIITSDLKLPSKDNVIHKVINQINDNSISEGLKMTMSFLEEDLKMTGFVSPTCAVRNRKLIISTCPYQDLRNILKDNIIMLMQIVWLVNNEYNKFQKSLNDKKKDIDPTHYLYSANKKQMCDDKRHDNATHSDITYPRKKTDAKETDIKEKKMIGVPEGLDIIRNITQKASLIDTEVVRTRDAYGRVSAQIVYATADVPSFRTSAKHGYAMLASDGMGIRKVIQTSSSAATGSNLIVHGTCMWVRTGVAIPDGATAVVMPENVKIAKKRNDHNDYFNMAQEIDVLIEPQEGANIRDVGCEIKNKQRILRARCRLGPAELRILTLCGINEIIVFKEPSIGLISIGDELEEPGNILIPGRIYDSNRITLSSLLRKNDYDSVDFGISVYQ